jgi:tetratricopeptide (TPR) repeat protein
VLTDTELTGDDLAEIRRTALGTADPLGVAADLADAVDAGRLADPGDAASALLLAAEIAESRSKLEAALRYADRAVDADGELGLAPAVRARILFRAGRADDAMADLERVRPLLTQIPDAAAYVSAALSAGGRNRVAEEWLTEAVDAALAGRSGEPASAEDAGLLFFLLQQRHRIRHALNRPHDAHDNLAERLETRLANAATREEQADALVFWPKDDLDRLLTRWPALSEAYGRDWDDHRARLEREFVRRRPAVYTGSAAGLIGYAGGDGEAPDAKTRNGYAGQLASGAQPIAWPPERNGACWCGSGLKYKKCCLPRARG